MHLASIAGLSPSGPRSAPGRTRARAPAHTGDGGAGTAPPARRSAPPIIEVVCVVEQDEVRGPRRAADREVHKVVLADGSSLHGRSPAIRRRYSSTPSGIVSITLPAAGPRFRGSGA